MSVELINSPVIPMWNNRSATVQKFGKDQTGTVDYQFNSQGFRSNVDYNFVPDYAVFGCSIVFGIGVPLKDTFAGQFESIHNYGLASNYDSTDCFNVVQQFVSSKWYNENTKMAVIWTDRGQEILPEYVEKLQQYRMIHFFCGNRLNLANCYSVKSNLDLDVSGTHPGPRTHKFIYKLLCPLFDRL